jgi:hypothetical protein
MKKFIFLATMWGLIGAANAESLEPPSCSQIRAQINAQTGIVTKPDVALLQSLSERSDCRFSAPEVYRAAYGDKPFPKNDRGNRQPTMQDDDD